VIFYIDHTRNDAYKKTSAREIEMTKFSNKAIREYLGHNGCECRVRISRDGSITRYGSPNPFDRSMDFWAPAGHVDDVTKDMANSKVYA